VISALITVMAMLAAFDDLLTAVYDAGQGKRSVGEMLARSARLFESVAAGFLIYDRDGQQVTHSVVAPPRSGLPDWQDRLREMAEDPAIRILSRIRLREPRRFTDLVPRPRLRNASWFLRQEVLAGLGYGIAVDLDLTGLRVRMFGMRAAGAPDFESGPLELLGRVARHVERAFAGSAHRLAPESIGVDAATLVYRPQEFSNVMREVRPVERQLATRFGLTATEARVAVAAAAGLSRVQTAEQLGISLNSLKTHLRRVHSKLGISRAGELVRAVTALEAGR
jgi:DNA-binding CsgD family transcriptional regulator